MATFVIGLTFSLFISIVFCNRVIAAIFRVLVLNHFELKQKHSSHKTQLIAILKKNRYVFMHTDYNVPNGEK